MNLIKNFKKLPGNTKLLLGFGGLFALFVALPLFIYAVTTQNFEIRNRAQEAQTPPPVPLSIYQSFDGTGELNSFVLGWTGVEGSSAIRESDQLKISTPQGHDQVGGNDASVVIRVDGQNLTPQGDFTASVELNGVTISGQGGGYQQFSYGFEGVGIRRHKVGQQETIEAWNQVNGSGSLNNMITSVNLVDPAGPVIAKFVKTGSDIQAFYNIGQGDVLLTTQTISGDLAPIMVVSNDSDLFPAVSALFDNYQFQGYVAGTPFPSSSPESTETPSPSPGVSSCNEQCSLNADCQSGLVCLDGLCRNPTCTTSGNCSCSTASPSATPTDSPTPTPSACNISDINKDYIVDIIDYGIFVSDFFETVPNNPRSDINSDGIVDVVDYSIMVSSFFNQSDICQ